MRGPIEAGQRFGRLTVIEHADGQDLWRCKCDCGNETIAKGTLLKNQHKRSCGCLLKEHIERQKKTWKI